MDFKRLAKPVCYARPVICLDDNDASEFVSGSLVGSALTKVESHLASCRDCRDLVAALAGADAHDSNADTRKRELVEDSQLGKRPTKTLGIGDRVGRYLVLSTLGAGGMGVVFSAYDPQLDRKIALKLLRANLGGTAKEARARLKREAQAIAQLNHPNVVGVYDVGETDDGDVYVAMEFVEGDTLTTWLRRWPRTWREILDVFHQAARGLMAAHSVGLLHRDFKPDNVLVGGDGRVRVSDFGLARSLIGPDEVARPRQPSSPLHVDLTATGTVLGTPRYMPPEQLTGPDIDARSDQFSFCIALYEALFGTHPLPGATSVSMLESGARALAPPEGSRVPSGIAKAVQRGLEKDRAKRFPTMAALITELTPPAQRSPARFVSFALVGLVLIGGATAAVMASRPPAIQQRSEMPEIEKLHEQINQLELERKQLKEQLLKRETNLKEIQKLEKELALADEKIQDLVGEVSKLRANEQQAKAAIRPAPVPVDVRVANAIADPDVQHSIEGCFDEWSNRQGLDIIDKLKPPPKDADLVVHLSVTPDGIGHSAEATGEDSPSLRFCVESAVSRAHYPIGKEGLDLSVQVTWAEPNLVNTSARVVGHHEASRSTIDLQ
ncbi:MAG: serine/threonine protein kinase [Myxococcales bacterium]|nr:serine/threonine protein kinase [Myxococcales bacterium]